jgi:hypothetical protein
MQNLNKQRVIKIAKALEELNKEVAFVGGAVVSFYADSKISEIRPTDDIDCVITGVFNRLEYNSLEEKLRQKGFLNDIESGIICRWLFKNIVVDIMPCDESILGFSNKWYSIGFDSIIEFEISDTLKINLFSAPIFLVCKLEALKNRGGKDLRGQKDFEDIVFLLSNRVNLLDEIRDCLNTEVKDFIRNSFKELIENENIDEFIECALPRKEVESENITRIKDLMLKISII